MPRKPFPCAVCGEVLRPGPRTLPEGEAAHAKCRGWAARGDRKHGTTAMYDKGKCRCDRCKAAVAARQRRYVAKRKSEGRPVDFGANRRLPAECEQCGISFLARTDKSRSRFCSLGCANDFQGRDERPRFRIAESRRAAIYEACEWKCQLCLSPVRPEQHQHHPRYPTLDHIVPRARGGSDDESNLRLACFQCNTRRGTNVDWVPVLVEVDDESPRQIA